MIIFLRCMLLNLRICGLCRVVLYLQFDDAMMGLTLFALFGADIRILAAPPEDGESPICISLALTCVP